MGRLPHRILTCPSLWVIEVSGNLFLSSSGIFTSITMPFLELLDGNIGTTNYFGNEVNKFSFISRIPSNNIKEFGVFLKFNYRLRTINISHLKKILVILARKLLVNNTTISNYSNKFIVLDSYGRIKRIVAVDNEHMPLIFLPPCENIPNEHKQFVFYLV